MAEQAPQPSKLNNHLAPWERANLEAAIERLQAADLSNYDNDNGSPKKALVTWKPDLDWVPSPSAEEIKSYQAKHGSLDGLPHNSERNYDLGVTNRSHVELPSDSHEVNEAPILEPTNHWSFKPENHIRSYEDLVKEADAFLKQAIELEEDWGMAAAANHYERAMQKYLSATAVSPSETLELNPDYSFYLKLGGVQGRLSSFENLTPYESDESTHINRNKALFKAMEKSFDKAMTSAGGLNADPEVALQILSQRADMYTLQAQYKKEHGEVAQMREDQEEAFEILQKAESIVQTSELEINPQLVEWIDIQTSEARAAVEGRTTPDRHIDSAEFLLHEVVAA